jgi:hypothetical protein
MDQDEGCVFIDSTGSAGICEEKLYFLAWNGDMGNQDSFVEIGALLSAQPDAVFGR